MDQFFLWPLSLRTPKIWAILFSYLSHLISQVYTRLPCVRSRNFYLLLFSNYKNQRDLLFSKIKMATYSSVLIKYIGIQL